MKKPIALVIAPLVFSAVPALSDTDASQSCDAKFETVSTEWAEEKKSLTESEEVPVTTEEREVEVEAEDAQPTENWFGNPPDVDTVDGYLAEAETAMQDGDEEACMEQLKNVEAAMNPEEGNVAEKLENDEETD